MKTTMAVLLVFIAAPPAAAANRPHVSAKELVSAVNEADPRAVPYRHGKLSASEKRALRCVGSDEEPTEFRCTWEQRTLGAWVKRETGLAIDGAGWHVTD